MPSNLDAPERRVNKRPSDRDLRADRVAPRAVALKDSGDMKAALLDRKTKRNTSKYVERVLGKGCGSIVAVAARTPV